MSDYIENSVAFTQGSPQSEVQIMVLGNVVTMTTDWFVINSNTSAESRGRVIDQGVINLNTGSVSTNPSGSPIASPTHGGVSNLVNNLAQSFTLDCSASSDFIVSADNGLYSFRLSRVG